MVLQVGDLDIIQFLEHKGIKWQRNDVDGPNAGRTLDATMHRDRVATKIRLDCTCKPLTTLQASQLLEAIQPEYIDVTYTDVRLGAVRQNVRMYSNNVPATHCVITSDGTEYWEGITFPLIEV